MKLTRGSFALPGTTLNYHTGSWRTQKPHYRKQTAPCHAVCPAGENAQEWIALFDEGHPQAAWEALVKANPLPAISGRVCPHPCESSCNRQQLDEPVAIHSLERHLGDLALAEGWPYPIETTLTGEPRVAVIGAGPSGLSLAWQMVRHGVAVDVFDREPEAGGTLFAIPGYRLPKDVVRQEVQRLLETGIRFHANPCLGRDFDLASLQQRYEAVYLAPGLMQSREWSVDGVTPKDLHDGLNLLKEWMDIGEIPAMQSAAVVGGGNTAIDVARVLQRNGVETHIVIHSGLPGPNTDPADAMRAIPREIEQAQQEGVKIHDHHGIKRLLLRGARVVGVEMVRMRKLPDQSGRLHRIAFEGTETILNVDQVIPAIGQTLDRQGLETLLEGGTELPLQNAGALPQHPGLYAGGDCIAGNRGIVSEAVGNGRKAAQGILDSLKITALGLAEPALTALPFTSLNSAYFEPAPRQYQALLALGQRVGEIEIETGLSHQQADAEAHRCLSCGACMACDNCWTLCPDSAVLKAPTPNHAGSPYRFDYDYCKGCGLCANECPCGHIEMLEEV